MSAAGWLTAAALVALLDPGGGAPTRADALVAAGRLAASRTMVRPGPPLPPGPAAGLGVAGGVALVMVTGGPLLAAAAGVAAATGWSLYRDVRRRRERVSEQAALRVAVRVLIGELEGGARAATALAAAGDVAPPHRAVFAAAASAAAEARDAGAAMLASADTRTIGLAWHVAADTGMALAGVLGRVADDLQADEDRRRAVDAALAGPRASALLLSCLPVVGIALGTTMGAHPLTVLTATTAGQALCCAGVVLDAAGVLWMRRILRRAERA